MFCSFRRWEAEAIDKDYIKTARSNRVPMKFLHAMGFWTSWLLRSLANFKFYNHFLELRGSFIQSSQTKMHFKIILVDNIWYSRSSLFLDSAICRIAHSLKCLCNPKKTETVFGGSFEDTLRAVKNELPAAHDPSWGWERQHSAFSF